MGKLNVALEGVAISTRNLKRMIRFYNEVFDVALKRIDIGNVLFYEGRIGNLNITFSSDESESQERGHYQLSFGVSDLDEVLRRTKRTGGAQLQEIQVYDGDRYCGIVDPDGNTIELIESYPIFQYP